MCQVMTPKPWRVIPYPNRMCVPGFDSKALERGLVAQAGTVPTFQAAIISVQKIRYYKQAVQGKSKWPITVGHTTVLARPTFFSVPNHEPGFSPLAPTLMATCVFVLLPTPWCCAQAHQRLPSAGMLNTSTKKSFNRMGRHSTRGRNSPC